jgi:hypothetical protein
MPSDSEYRQLSLKMGQTSPDRVEWKKLFRESLDTLILGSLSTSIGVVVLIAILSGMVGRPVQGWNEPPIIAGGKYLIPTIDCGIAAVVGEFLGVAGILVGQVRRGAISPLSTLGTVICLAHMYLFFIHVAVMGLL